jgi:hydroxymethylbilane synthase
VSPRRPGLRIGTRESDLAQWQASHVASALRALPGAPEPELVLIRTEGDRIQDVPLSQVQGKAFFTKEIEAALLAGEVDIAVHSLKDLATQMPGGLALGAVMERGDPRDALLTTVDHDSPNPSGGRISPDSAVLPASFPPVPGLDGVLPGARVGTSSLRRRAFLARWRPDLELAELRGNVPTRIRKLDEGQYDGIVLAAAGVKRLGLGERISAYLPFDAFLPAVSQGAIGVQIRAGDEGTAAWVGRLDHAATRWATTAERALLRRLEGGCHVPVGAYAEVVSENDGAAPGVVAEQKGAVGAGVDEARGLHLRLRATLCSLDGRWVVEGERRDPLEWSADLGTALGDGPGSGSAGEAELASAERLGTALAEELLDRGGDEILAGIRTDAGGR